MPDRIKTTAAECDAFSRRARGLMGWKAGKIKKLKRAYAKRVRQMVKQGPAVEPDCH